MLKGFTTKNFLRERTFRIFGVDVIGNDIKNYIMTIKGERPHMPNFGTRIPLLAFKPIDQYTIAIIEQDLKEAVREDGRVELIDFAVLPQGYGIKVVMDLKVKYSGETFNLELTTS